MNKNKKFHVINPGQDSELPASKAQPKKPATNAELILDFMKRQVKELEEYISLEGELPLQKAVLIYGFGDTDSFEEIMSSFQFISVNFPTPEFFLLTDKMKHKYISDLEHTLQD